MVIQGGGAQTCIQRFDLFQLSLGYFPELLRPTLDARVEATSVFYIVIVGQCNLITICLLFS